MSLTFGRPHLLIHRHNLSLPPVLRAPSALSACYKRRMRDRIDGLIEPISAEVEYLPELEEFRDEMDEEQRLLVNRDTTTSAPSASSGKL